MSKTDVMHKGQVIGRVWNQRWRLVAGGTLTLGMVALVGRQLALAVVPVALVVALLPYWALGALVGAVMAALRRHLRWASALFLLSAVLIATQVPLFVGPPPAPALARVPPGVPLNVLSVNIKLGQADLSQVAQMVQQQQVDVLVVVELTDSARQRAAQVGIDRLLPYHHLRPAQASLGLGMWSRWPLQQVGRVHQMSSANLVAQVGVPGAGPVSVVGVHPTIPLYPREWPRQVQALRTHLAGLAGPVVAVGDFNATLDMPPLRGLQRDGYLDVGSYLGEGWGWSWAPLTRGPRLFSLDHALIRGGVQPVALQRFGLSGSDHRGLLVRLQVPAAG